MVKISLMVTPTYEESKHPDKLKDQVYDSDTIYQKYNDFVKHLTLKPHWTGIGAVNQELAKVLLLNDGSYQRYPAVALIAHIDGKTKS